MPPRRPAFTAKDTPCIDPRDGLRQRQLADGSWRVWWEPSAKQRKAGGTPVDLSRLKPGDAQRKATALAKAASDGAPKPRGFSIDALADDYLVSRYFTKLAASSKTSYLVDLRAITEKWGPQPVAILDAPTMVVWYETLLKVKGVFRARAIMLMFGILMEHAERRGWIPKGSNPCTDLGMERGEPRERVASEPEILALLDAAAADLEVTLALRLALATGQRQMDLLKAKPEEFTRTAMPVPGQVEPVPAYIWQLVRSKRGNAGAIPIVDPECVAALDVQIALAGEHGPGVLIWNSNTGKAFGKDRFFPRWNAVRAAAALACPSIATLQWRDLRRTVGGMVRAAGVSRDDAGDLLGNTLASNPQLAQTYTAPQLATTLRAVAAINLPKRKKA